MSASGAAYVPAANDRTCPRFAHPLRAAPMSARSRQRPRSTSSAPAAAWAPIPTRRCRRRGPPTRS
eukprot:365191-Chlamydomonas_euryale.AAC.2